MAADIGYNYSFTSMLYSIHAYQKELEEMKLKFNLLDEENAKLESQIFVMHKQMEQSKVEYRKLVGRCRELKDRQWNDVGCQTDLVCIIGYIG